MVRTMHDVTGEPIDKYGKHICCDECGMCVDCGDCACYTRSGK